VLDAEFNSESNGTIFAGGYREKNGGFTLKNVYSSKHPTKPLKKQFFDENPFFSR
jgi:hypothetical protein